MADEERSDDSEELPRLLVNRALRWTTEHVTATVSLFGLICYALTMIGYRLYFSSYGITPERLGYTYSRVLSEQAALLIVVIVGVLAAIVVLKARFSMNEDELHVWQEQVDKAVAALRKGENDGVKQERILELRRDLEVANKHLLRAALRMSKANAITAICLLAVPIAWATALLLQGALEDTGRRDPSLLSPLQVHVAEIHLFAVSADGTAKEFDYDQLGLDPKDHLLLLGESDGRAFIHSVDDKATVSIDTSDIAVATED